MRITTTVAITLVLLAGAWASAAELALRPQCESRGPVVTLGDVVDVVTTDSGEAARLAAIELFPSPAPGRQRHVRQREIQDLLLLRGVNLARHRFSGSSQVAVCRAGAPTKTEPEKSLSMSTQRRVKRQVCEAIIDYLNQKVEATQPWSVELELDESQTRLLAQAGAAAAIDGGQNPWTGKQRFDVTVNLPEGSGTRFALDAQVALPPAVVVTTHAMPRGVVVRATDVMLDRGEAAIADGEGFHAIEEVVGRETTRAVPVGKILKRDSVRAPLLVRRSEIVTVSAVAGGIRVTTNARARADGSHGELIPVESLQDRATYFARVCGLREVEVYAGAVRTRRTAATPVALGKQGTRR